MMSHKQALIIYNPLSGKRKKHSAFPIILNKLSEIGYHLTVNELNEVNYMNNPIRKACTQKWDAIFIAGGDGTVNQTIQFLAEEEFRPNVGVFPFGTSNEFAKFMRVPSNIIDVVSVIESGCITPVDLGKFGNRYFINIAAAGWLADITYETPPFLKSKFGELAYCLYFFKKLLFKKPSDNISINISDTVFSDLSLFLIMNGNSVGPLERLIDEKICDDGYFHLLTYKKTTRIRLLFHLFAKLLNLSNDLSIIQHTKINEADFMLPESISLNLDGELASVNSSYFQVLPQHLNVFGSNKNN
jgi:diacylglycerol kinase (ATP)